FAKQYPAAAGRLLLEPGRSGDPHIERLIESFALLAARVHNKLDDEFPELTDALFSVLYPHYLAPIPSMAVVQFVIDPAQAALPHAFVITQDTRPRTMPVMPVVCRFRTAYPPTLWPIELESARLTVPPFPPGFQPPPRTIAALVLQCHCQSGLKFADLSLDKLRLYLAGDNQVVARIYAQIFNHTKQCSFSSWDMGPNPPTVTLASESCLHQVGFEAEDSLLPYPPQAFLGYRLLTEFFAFPNKFHFVDLGGWPKVAKANFP